jgi:hypothetical protein
MVNIYNHQIYFFLLSKLAGFSSFDTTGVYNFGTATYYNVPYIGQLIV